MAALRSRKTVLHVGPQGPGTITIRVEMPEVWDVVAMTAAPSEMVVAVKQAALQALYPEFQRHEDFVMKLRGWEMLNEHESLSAAGVTDGSILLLTFRRRRAVR